jgi:endoglucanase
MPTFTRISQRKKNIMFKFIYLKALLKISSWLVLVFILFSSLTVSAQCISSSVLRGVNIAGAEFNASKVPGVINKDYLYPNNKDLDYVVTMGGNVIRLPFRWERLQPSLNEDFDAFELGNIKRIVAAANVRGLCVILDVHNYGGYGKNIIGSTDVPVTAFHDLWRRLALIFSDPEKTVFGLMNEPVAMSIGKWATTAQSTVLEIRKQNSRNIILVASGRWSGAHEWFKKFDGISNSEAYAELADPENRTWIELHQYADTYFSGTEQICINPNKFKKLFVPLIEWSKSKKIKFFLGEFGVAPNENCLESLSEILIQIADTKVWAGWTYWATGRWWGNYPLSIQMKDGIEPAQVKILREYIAK